MTASSPNNTLPNIFWVGGLFFFRTEIYKLRKTYCDERGSQIT